MCVLRPSQDVVLATPRREVPVYTVGSGGPQDFNLLGRRSSSPDARSWVERAEAREDEHERELALADAAEFADSAAETDETRFDETRLAYSGVQEGDGDVDVQELEERAQQLDDPEREAPRADL
jgi:hypothetical protein